MNFEEIKMKNQPEEIYLNLGDDIDCDDYNELVEGEIGWSTEPCTTDVLRYVRADLKAVSLRDKFAMAAMQGFCAGDGYDIKCWDVEVAYNAYKIADAMLEERLK